MPRGRMKHLQIVVGECTTCSKEAAYGPNLQHLDELRAAQRLEREYAQRTALRGGNPYRATDCGDSALI